MPEEEEDELEKLERELRELERVNRQQIPSSPGPTIQNISAGEDPVLQQTERLLKLDMASGLVASRRRPDNGHEWQKRSEYMREESEARRQSFEQNLLLMEKERQKMELQHQQWLQQREVERQQREEEYRRNKELRDEELHVLKVRKEESGSKNSEVEELKKQIAEMRAEKEREEQEKREAEREARLFGALERIEERIDDIEDNSTKKRRRGSWEEEDEWDDDETPKDRVARIKKSKQEEENLMRDLKEAGINVSKGLGEMSNNQLVQWGNFFVHMTDDLLSRPSVVRALDRLKPDMDGLKDIRKRYKAQKMTPDEINDEEKARRDAQRHCIANNVDPDVLVRASRKQVIRFCDDKDLPEARRNNVFRVWKLLKGSQDRVLEPLVDEDGFPLLLTDEVLALNKPGTESEPEPDYEDDDEYEYEYEGELEEELEEEEEEEDLDEEEVGKIVEEVGSDEGEPEGESEGESEKEEETGSDEPGDSEESKTDEEEEEYPLYDPNE